MKWVKRIVLFLAVNILVMLTISFLFSLLNVKPYLTAHGLDYSSLMIFCLIWGMTGAFISLALSKQMAKWMMGVKIIDPNYSNPQFQRLYATVVRLSKTATLPQTPEVGVFQSKQLNAFATGPTKRHSLVAVSSALLEQMNEEELEAILGHEITHIANGDMVTMTLLQGVVNAFVMFLSRVLAYALSSASKERNGRVSYGSFYLLSFLFEIVFMILGSIVIAAFSRWREFRADKGGAFLSKKEHMIAALEKLGRSKEEALLKKASSFQALMISTTKRGGLLHLFATHPPIEIRVERLKASL
ncbi:MAG: protease HtpX [Simkania negevensis]|nr:protease HtpX [Simkania negevensis]